MAARRSTYVRFVIASRNPSSGLREGLFRTAYRLRREGELQAHEYARLDLALAWLDNNLPVPGRFNRSTSKGASQRNSNGLCWFKSSAREAIGQVRTIVDILSEYGYAIETLTTRRPGYFVYEDDIQVVAEPFADTPGRQ